MPSLSQLVESLLRGTTDGKLSWSANSESSFALQLESGTVSVASRDGDGQAPHILAIFNRDGVQIESVYTDELDATEAHNVASLYAAARSGALGIEATVSALLREIEQKRDDIPF